MGLVKVDLLGLGMMAVLQDAIELVNRPGSTPIQTPEAQIVDLAHLPPDDPDVYQHAAGGRHDRRVSGRVARADGHAAAAAARSFLRSRRAGRDHPSRARSSGRWCIRILNRRAGREPVTYAHPPLEPILARTLGVPLFQEQLLRMAMVTAGFSGGQAEELRRAFGFKRSERRMKQVEVKLREGMARQGITGDVAEQIISSITAFALYGFPESHAASFALLAYASAYLKVHFPAAFYTAMLNNQPMGFYHPATLVKDAQRRGVRFTAVDVQHSDWLCRVEDRRRHPARPAIRVTDCARKSAVPLSEHRGQAPGIRRISSASPDPRIPDLCARSADATTARCSRLFGRECSSATSARTTGRHARPRTGPRKRHALCASVDELVNRTGARRDELQMLADIGAFASFGYERREALWQVEKAVRPAGELFAGCRRSSGSGVEGFGTRRSPEPAARSRIVRCRPCRPKSVWWPTMPART